MALNKLENFIKNLDGRILYVNPQDLDATDSITNQGNSLTRPFKTLQRALLESSRFSFVKGNNNDFIEKTTILLFPGEYVIDNRPGYGIYKYNNTTAYVIRNDGSEQEAQTELSLKLDTNFDITSDDNILYKFNSVYGGVIVPRGTSIIGLDLKKTKIRPRYVPNPTDPSVKHSSIFKITGGCYFWQFSIFDGDQNNLVFTDPVDFSALNKSKPAFSHHKLFCFEYADGVNIPKIDKITRTDLDMYYAKVSNAYNIPAGETKIDEEYKYPDSETGFVSQRPEWEIVGAFASDPLKIEKIYSGELVGGVSVAPTSKITVITEDEHKLSVDTPIKISGVKVSGVESLIYNISTRVSGISDTNPREFYYLIPDVPGNLDPNPTSLNAFTIIETDTVSGSSPYISYISLRSEWGMNGALADGNKASGFRSLLLSQFTGISLQKDDRAFVRYNPITGVYDKNEVVLKKGSELPSYSTAALPLHLDSNAIYRPDWETSHIQLDNNAFSQVVSVFSIGFSRHYYIKNGSDCNISNSSSNFGQTSLVAEGFKNYAFGKDSNGYITSIISPRAVSNKTLDYDWVSLDAAKTRSVASSTRLYLYGYFDVDSVPSNIVQGFRVGANSKEKLYVNINGNVYSSTVTMSDNTSVSEKVYNVTGGANSNKLIIGTHSIANGEKIRVLSEGGDLPENVSSQKVYYAIISSGETTTVKLASSKSNADIGIEIPIYRGSKLSVVSRVSDKTVNELGSPIQYDYVNNGWYINVSSTNNQIYTQLSSGTLSFTDKTYIKRVVDNRSIDEKLYKVRYVIPKEYPNSRGPEEGFILQEYTKTGLRKNSDATSVGIGSTDYDYNKNLKIISWIHYDSGTNIGIATCEVPHGLKLGEVVTIKNVKSVNNPVGAANSGYNGVFTVTNSILEKTFQYSLIDNYGVNHGNPGVFTSNLNERTVDLPRIERSDLKCNYFIYKNEVISPYIDGTQDGIYHLCILNSDNEVSQEFTERAYSQNIIDLYPQFDKDNVDDNPNSAKSYAKSNPLGEVITNDVRKSITRETIDELIKDFNVGISTILSVTNLSTQKIFNVKTDHGLNSISNVNITVPGTGLTPASGIATYRNVRLLNTGTTNWYGAYATVIVTNGSVSNVDITAGGSGYNTGNVLDIELPSTTTSKVAIDSTGLCSGINNTVQITGIGTTSSSHYRITNIVNNKRITVACTSGDPIVHPDQYAIVVSPTYIVSSSTYSSSGICTINTTLGNDLFVGNKITALDINNNNLGEYLVTSKVGISTFTIVTSSQITPRYILKHALSAQNAISDASEENIGARGLCNFDRETLYISGNSDITATDTEITVSLPDSGIGTSIRFPMGSYIQIDEEIMRVSKPTLQGVPAVRLAVIRGVLGTNIKPHLKGSLIKKIKPIPIELRRPSIITASSHNFQYLGYGPGNYSTSLPQLQEKTLSEKENFLSQSQELSGGNVVYFGTNSSGDLFLSNTKISGSTGKQTSYDIPTQTIVGQEVSRESSSFDELIIKEGITVEGGNSNKIVSQFNGPVTFNEKVTANNDLDISGLVNIKNSTNSTSKGTGALVVNGGVGIGSNLNVGGTIFGKIVSTFNGIFNVKDFGAVGDGVTSDGPAFQAALNAARDAGGGVVYIPPGRYLRNDSPNSEWKVYSNTTLMGAGDQSVILFNDVTTTPKGASNDLIMINTNSKNVTFKDFKIEGTLLSLLTEDNAKNGIMGFKVDGFRLENVTFLGMRSFATGVTELNNAIITGNTLLYIGRDGLRFTHSSNVVCTNNTFKAVCDSSIAAHSYNNVTPLPTGILISNNTFDSSSGIDVIGAKNVTISNNVFTRSLRAPISVTYPRWNPLINDPVPEIMGEGSTNGFNVKITGNNISDTCESGVNFNIGLFFGYPVSYYGITSATLTTAGTGLTPASGITTYTGVNLLNTGTSTWRGGVATVTVTNGTVTNVQVTLAGVNYAVGDILDIDLPATIKAKVTVNSVLTPLGRTKSGAYQPGVNYIPYPYNYQNNIFSSGTLDRVGLFNIDISNNTISRTLPSGGSYSALGFTDIYQPIGKEGWKFDRNTFSNNQYWINPTILEVPDPNIPNYQQHSFASYGIYISSPVNGVTISNNIIQGVSYAGIGFLYFSSENVLDYNNFLISNNLIYDVKYFGILFSTNGLGTSNVSTDLTIQNNIFDIDPYYRNPTHLYDNTWTSLNVSRAIYNTVGHQNIKISGNTFKNCASTGIEPAPGDLNLSTLHQTGMNYIYSDFIAVGGGRNDTGTNLGVRYIPSSRQLMVIPIYGDPSNTAISWVQGAIRNKILLSSPTVPTSGYYIRDTFVEKTDVSAVQGNVIIGWWRVTTGGGHSVDGLNPDWVSLRATIP